MGKTGFEDSLRCSRCGRVAAAQDKFCAECGMFLRDAFVDDRLLLALEHEKEGRSKEARQELQRLLEANPDNVIANHLLGTLYFHQGTLDLAIECYEKAVENAPAFTLAFYDLGVAWYHRGNMPEAIRAFNRCLEIDPHYNAAHYRLALSRFHAGLLDDALEHFEEAAALTPEYLMANYHMGVIHERRNKPEVAERAYRRNLDESVGEVSSIYHLALLRRSQGDESQAEDLLKRTREFALASNIRPKAVEQES